jgi:hypothetical protein
MEEYCTAASNNLIVQIVVFNTANFQRRQTKCTVFLTISEYIFLEVENNKIAKLKV